MTTKYTYVEADFANNKFTSSSLGKEIRDSTIIIGLKHIKRAKKKADITFKTDLSGAEKTTLDGIVAAHTGEPLTVPKKVLLDPDAHKTTGKNIIRVALEKTTLARRTLFSHNWCDRTTWYTEAVRVVDEVATDSGDQIRYDLANQSAINTYHGKLTEEDYLTDSDGYSFRMVVKVNDVAKTEQDPHYGTGGDYVVHYSDGYVEFQSALSGGDVVKVTYHYENGSMCKFKPPAGESWDLTLTELQFSLDTILKDSVVFSVYGLADVFAPGQFPAGTMIPLQNSEKFKTMMDFYNDSVRSYPITPALGGSTWRGVSQPMLVLDWDYVTAQTLTGDYGMEIRVYLEHNEAFEGEFSTATFYFTVED